VDYDISHALDRFSAHHDGFEDVLGAYVASSEILFVIVLVALFLLVPGRLRPVGRHAAVAAGVSLLVAIVVAHFLGVVIDRQRPFVAHPNTIRAFLPHANDPAFPSDHATAAFAIGTAVLLWHRAWGVILLLLATVLAVGRVFLGLHYPTDVISGAVLGAACGLLFYVRPLREPLARIADFAGERLDRLVLRAGRRQPG
jgi:undecaprenyl-diphosphatase